MLARLHNPPCMALPCCPPFAQGGLFFAQASTTDPGSVAGRGSAVWERRHSAAAHFASFSASSSSSAEYGYDAFITAIGPLTPSGSQYIAFYHNKQADADVSGADYAKPIEYDGTTLYYSGLGAGGVKLTNDIVVYFTMLTY